MGKGRKNKTIKMKQITGQKKKKARIKRRIAIAKAKKK
jgi:hypothetical protein